MKRITRNYILFFSLILPFTTLFSETVLLRNGESVKGKVIGQDYGKIVLETKEKTETGEKKTIEIRKATILKIVFKDIDEEEVARLRQMEEEKMKSPESEEELKRKEEAALAEKQKSEEEEKKRNEALAEKKREWEKNRVSPFGALGRSALLPGWGQWENDRKITGAIYGVLFFTSAVALYNKNREYLNAKRDYENIGNPYSEAQYFTNFYGASGTATLSQTNLTDPVTAYLYNNSNPTLLQREAVERHYNEVKKLSYLVAGIYLINLLDAFFRYEEKPFLGMEKGFYMDYSIARSSAIGYSPNASGRMDEQYMFGYKFSFGTPN